jgi:hypothetical protein
MPHVARMGEDRKSYKVLVVKPEGKRPLGRPRRRWENGVRMGTDRELRGGRPVSNRLSHSTVSFQVRKIVWSYLTV